MDRRLVAAWALLVAAGTAAAQGPAAQGGAFLGSHNPPPFTPTQVFTGPQAAILKKPPADPPTDLLTGEPLPPPSPWSGSIDAGLNGATGNTDLLTMRANGHAKRQSATNILTGDLLYSYTSDTGRVTVHQVLSNARDEFLFASTPWSAFVSSLLEYDELRNYRFRVAVYAGVGYTVVDTADLTFKLRAGAGAVREIGSGGLADRWVPELIFGKDFRWKLSDTDSFVSTLEYYPRVDDFTQFRVRARAAYEHVISPATGMLVRLGAQDRYDSNPGNSRRNDLTYFATFGVKF